MVWLAVNSEGTEICCNYELVRVFNNRWSTMTEKEISTYCYESNGDPDDCIVVLPKGTIKKLIGKELTWKDNSIKIE